MKALANRVRVEVAIKNALLIVISFTVTRVFILGSLGESGLSNIKPVLFAGFFMILTAIGITACSYSKINVEVALTRYLTHAVKFFFYLTAGILIWFIVDEVDCRTCIYKESVYASMFALYVSIILYDFWDAECAINRLTISRTHDPNSSQL